MNSRIQLFPPHLEVTHRGEVAVLAAVEAPFAAEALRAAALLAAPLVATFSRRSPRLRRGCRGAVARNVAHLSAHPAFARVRLFRRRACLGQVTYFPAVAASAGFSSRSRSRSSSIALPLLEAADRYYKQQRFKDESVSETVFMLKCQKCIHGICLMSTAETKSKYGRVEK
jgi:hypothetical protein